MFDIEENSIFSHFFEIIFISSMIFRGKIYSTESFPI